ncbi:MAG TPA: type III pantothenate kinase [Abditibacteriaceae bacterium]|nr:type III pantothenate kinase [Abditibacteriaceae bacterium]
MLLALDIGNTNITAGVFDGSDLLAQWRLSTRRDRTADELATFLKVALDAWNFHFADVHGVAISSVVPTLTPQAELLAAKYFGCAPLIIGAHTDTGLINAYENPREVGADRLVNGFAAWQKFKTAVVIVDFGTGTTVDAVSQDGRYLGGAIAPGLQISADALFHAAARLPRVELIAPEHALGRNPAASMQAGIVFGYAGLVKELVARCSAEVKALGSPALTVLATGGLAELVAPLVPAIQHVEPQLTLEGLRLIWERSVR